MNLISRLFRPYGRKVNLLTSEQLLKCIMDQLPGADTPSHIIRDTEWACVPIDEIRSMLEAGRWKDPRRDGEMPDCDDFAEYGAVDVKREWEAGTRCRKPLALGYIWIRRASSQKTHWTDWTIDHAGKLWLLEMEDNSIRTLEDVEEVYFVQA